MAKKDLNNEVEIVTESEPMYEAEAYNAPQTNAGADVTVTRPVGIGAPVPIVAPKHTTIQLQPIVVPLAVIPYMSLDSDALASNRVQQAEAVQSTNSAVANAGPVDNAEETKKVKKKSGAKARVFALLTLILSAITLLPFILSYWWRNFTPETPIGYLNVIKVIEDWVKYGFNSYTITQFVYIAIAGLAALLVISSLISIICGKYARVLNCLFALGTAIGFVAVLIKDLVKQQFVIGDKIVFVVLLCVAVVNAILAIVFSVSLGRDKKKVARLEQEI